MGSVRGELDRRLIALTIGAVFWGVGSDVWGRKQVLSLEEMSLIECHGNRRISFNITLFMVGAFATAAGGSPNHIALIALAAVWSIGVGGNLPVDSSIFLG